MARLSCPFKPITAQGGPPPPTAERETNLGGPRRTTLTIGPDNGATSGPSWFLTVQTRSGHMHQCKPLATTAWTESRNCIVLSGQPHRNHIASNQTGLSKLLSGAAPSPKVPGWAACYARHEQAAGASHTNEHHDVTKAYNNTSYNPSTFHFKVALNFAFLGRRVLGHLACRGLGGCWGC